MNKTNLEQLIEKNRDLVAGADVHTEPKKFSDPGILHDLDRTHLGSIRSVVEKENDVGGIFISMTNLWQIPPGEIVAVDPGFKMGFSLVTVSETLIEASAFWVHFSPKETLFTKLNWSNKVGSHLSMFGTKVVLESASYNSPGNAHELLTQVRTSVMLGFCPEELSEDRIILISPMTARKTVFGHGRIKAPEIFRLPDVSPNALDAMVIGMAGLKYR